MALVCIGTVHIRGDGLATSPVVPALARMTNLDMERPCIYEHLLKAFQLDDTPAES